MARIDFDNNEQEFISAFSTGAPDAMEYLFRKYYVQLVDFARQITNNLHEAEDIVVETFLKLYKKKNDFSRQQEIKAFLFVCTKNSCIDYIRYLKTDEKFQKESLYLSAVLSEEKGYDFFRINAQIMQVLADELAALPERTRKVVNLIFHNKMSSREIAEELGVTVRTIQRERETAVERLKSSLLKKELIDFSIHSFFFLFYLVS